MEKEQLKQKNSSLSVIMIGVNLLLLIIFLNITPNSENEQFEAIAFTSFAFVVLVGLYAFSYHGKAYRAGKWIFGIALFIFLIFVGLLWYAAQLGKAFQH
jgi:hypothetical protein